MPLTAKTGSKEEEEPVEFVTDSKRLREILCKYPVVIAVFTSPTCAACAVYKPIFYAYAEEVLRRGGSEAKKKIKFIEVDVYHLYEEALNLGVMGTPTTIVFQNCKPVDGFPGAVDDITLVEILKPYTPVEIPYEFLEQYSQDYFENYPLTL